MRALWPGRADQLAAALTRMLGTSDWRMRLWDGTEVGPATGARFTVSIHSRHALDVLIGGTPERAFGRAYAAGHIDIEPLQPFLEAQARMPAARMLAAWPRLVAAAIALGARPSRGIGGSSEARLRGRMHSRKRDAAAVRHHYDLPPEFYGLWLDRTLTYSCAYFERADMSIDAAQQAKLDLVCRKLRLQPGERLLDIGCGWGSLVLFAAQHYGVHALGITLSPRQLDVARRRATELGVAERAEFRLADYRDTAGTYDAVASVGMIEHVGRGQLDVYARAVQRLLRPGGRALVHGITCRPGARRSRLSFINSFVFPDGALDNIGRIDSALETAGLEVRDVENLREHYALTLQHWVRRLEDHWDEAVRIAGPSRARVWRLYMTGSVVGFRIGAVAVHQTLVVRPTSTGGSGLPLVRADWYARGRVTDAVVVARAAPSAVAGAARTGAE